MSSEFKTVVKRNGAREAVDVKKILTRIQNLSGGLDLNFVNPAEVAAKVAEGIYDGVTTVVLDNLGAEVAASMTTKHPDYAVLAARVAISNLHKETNPCFSEVMQDLYEFRDKNGRHAPLVSQELLDIVLAHSSTLNSAIQHDQDFGYSYFGFKTLERSYLLKINEKVVERPQHLLMRVALGIHKNDIAAAVKTYNLTSEKWFTHASPTLFNAGTNTPQLSSCFLLTVVDDSVDGIFETLKTCAKIAETAGGIGLNVHQIRALGGNSNSTNGLIPMLRVFNNAARLIGKQRPSAFAIYLEPWHADILEFIELKKNTGCEEERARDLFYALWIPDLFMKRVKSDGMWSLMCPNECPGLEDCWGEKFETLYESYEADGRYRRQMKAREVWKTIVVSQIETGTPYMLYKDACNAKSNQQNLGTIKCSNLCTEIVEYSSPDEVAVCNLASIALPRFVDSDGRFNFYKLHEITKVVTVNLNKIIDVTYYPVPQAEKSNLRHRPIGIGVQGLADAFLLMRLPFASDAAKQVNKLIFETMYHAALEASHELAEQYGPYESYQGSPISKGILQHDMWQVEPSILWDWNKLRGKIAKSGVRNSLLLAPMPTASTAQILGNNESIEPYTSNIYSRRVLSGDFQIVNSHLIKDLASRSLWNESVKNMVIANGGSIQEIPGIPAELKELYKTVWEIKQRDIIDMAADRAAFIDQSQSLNLHLASPSYASCTSMHLYAWEKGLKTGMYYLRSRPAVDAIQFTVDKEALKRDSNANEPTVECLMCSG